MKKILLELEEEIYRWELQRLEIKKTRIDIAQRLKNIETDTAIKIYKAVDPQTNRPKYTNETQRKTAVDKLLEMDIEYRQLKEKDNELDIQSARLSVDIEHDKRLSAIERLEWETRAMLHRDHSEV